jgi:hypothetical protein
MIRNSFILLCLPLILFLSGCASLNQSQCVSADWSDLGSQDALRGKKSGYVAEHTKACFEYDIMPDFAAYKLGWQQAVMAFCQSDSGWRFGRKGRYYQQTCPQGSEQSFLVGYGLGKKIHSKEEEIREVKQEMRNLFRYSLAAKMTDQQHFSLSSERFSLSMDLQLLELERFRLYNKASALGLVP